MWYDSFDNGEPLQLSQDNDAGSYQLFGTLNEKMSQDDFDDFTQQEMQQPINSYKPRFPTEAWPEKNNSWYAQEIPLDYYSPGSERTQSEHAQIGFAGPPANWFSEVPEERNNVQERSTVLNNIQNLRSTRFTIDEEISEQKILNASILKQSSAVKEHIYKMISQNENLKNESQIMENKNLELEAKLDQETRRLAESIRSKRRDMSEIRYDAEVIKARREEKAEIAEEIKDLRMSFEDVDLDIYWLEHFYKVDYDKMVIFPFWKLEEDLERALQGEDPTLYKEEGPQERDHEAEGDGYDYEDDDFFDYEETIDEDEKSIDDFEEESAKEDAAPESDTCQPANRDSETDNCKSKSGRLNVLKLGRRFNSFIANISSGFGRSAGQKLPKKKNNNKSSCFVRWFRRVLRLPN